MFWQAFIFSFPLFIVAGLFFQEIRLAWRLQRVGLEALGQVLHQREVKTRNGLRFIPTVRFTTQLGQLVEAESTGNGTSPECFDGDELVVYYDPDHPTRFLFAQELANSKRRYALFAFLVIAALLVWLPVYK